MDSIQISTELADLQEIGVRAGICCGLDDPEIVKRLARECAEDFQRVNSFSLDKAGITPPSLP